MVENLLDIWISDIKRYTWKHGLITISPFSDIDRIKENLVFFFGQNKFEYEIFSPIPDQIYALLTTPKLSSLYKLAEISSTIDYYRKHSESQLLSLHGNKKKLSYDEIQGRFFELYINKILVDNKFNPSIKDQYTDSKNNDHPIDISFIFRDIKYLVECYKVSNPKRNLYVKLINDINKHAFKASKSARFFEMFSGYYVFTSKTITPDIIHRASETFKIAINQYFSEFKDNSNPKIRLDYQFENEDYQFKLFSNYVSANFNLENVTNSSSNSLVFKCVDIGPNGRVSLDFKPALTHLDIDTQIIDKIRNKKRQHKNSPIKNKLIIIEFENIKDNNLYQGSVPISPYDIKNFNFSKLIDSNTTIVFWLKTIESTKYLTNIGIIDHPNFDKNLKTRLLNLKINWY